MVHLYFFKHFVFWRMATSGLDHRECWSREVSPLNCVSITEPWCLETPSSKLLSVLPRRKLGRSLSASHFLKSGFLGSCFRPHLIWVGRISGNLSVTKDWLSPSDFQDSVTIFMHTTCIHVAQVFSWDSECKHASLLCIAGRPSSSVLAWLWELLLFWFCCCGYYGGWSSTTRFLSSQVIDYVSSSRPRSWLQPLGYLLTLQNLSAIAIVVSKQITALVVLYFHSSFPHRTHYLIQ